MLVPWLAVLALLLLPPNRSAQAWWIACPLAVAVGATSTLVPPLLGEAGASGMASTFQTMFGSLAFGAAAVWLLAPYLGHRLRFVAFLKMLLACGAVSGLSYLARQDWNTRTEAVGNLALLEICVLLTVGSLGLAGWVCRRRGRPLFLALWSAVFLALLPLGIATPFLLVGAGMSGAAPPWREVLTAVLSPAGACYVVLLLFLLLAFSNGFYRQRLGALLRLETAAPPVPAATSPPPSTEPLERSSI